jgi:hypothetical protein
MTYTKRLPDSHEEVMLGADVETIGVIFANDAPTTLNDQTALPKKICRRSSALSLPSP